MAATAKGKAKSVKKVGAEIAPPPPVPKAPRKAPSPETLATQGQPPVAPAPQTRPQVVTQPQASAEAPAGKPKKRHCCRWCCLSCLGLFIFSIIILLFLAAAAGLVHIWGISDIVYHPSQPSRTVVATQEKAGEIANKIENLALYVSDFKLAIPFSEEELTSGFQFNVFKDNPNVEDAQIVLKPGVIEFYARIIMSPIDTVVKFEISPTVNPDGTLKIETKSVTLGSLPILTFLTDFGVNPFMGQINKSLQESKNIRLTQIEIRDKLMVIRATATSDNPIFSKPIIQ